MIRRLRRKLNSEGGVTITECLAAILVAAFAVMMLATAVNAAAKSMQSAKLIRSDYDELLGQYYTGSETGSAENITINGDKTSGAAGIDDTFSISCRLVTKEYTVDGKSYEVYEFAQHD